MSIFRLKIMFTRGIWQLALVLWPHFIWFSSIAFANELRGQQLTDLVISAIDGNYSVIDSAQLTMRETVRDRSAKESKETVTKLPGGLNMTVFRSPKNITTLHLLLRGNNLRCERRHGNSGNGKIVEVYGFLDGLWTQHVPSITTAWIRLTDQLPPTFPLDPRHSGSADIRRLPVDILREDKLIRANMVREDNCNMVQIVAKSSGGQITTYQFSAEARFLPTRFYTEWDDGSLLQLVDIDYQPVLDGNALFPHRLRRRFFSQGKTKFPETAGWRQEMVREVVGDLEFNTHIDDAQLAVPLPSGTRVVNVSRGAIYGTKDPLTERRSLALPLNILVIVVLLGLVVIRFYRSKKQLAIT